MVAWRRIPIDVLAFVAIAIVIIATHAPLIATHGLCFNDPAWYFHFGHKTLGGDIPYRDYVFQVGPLPIFVDTGFQALFGATYVSSLYAGLFVKILRAYVVWLIVRRIAGPRAAALLMIFCAFDPLFAFMNNWSTSYALLFTTLAGLFCLLASRAEGRRALLYLALAGLNAALVMSARQSAGVLIGLVLVGGATVMLVRREYFTWPRLVALAGGYVFGVLVLAGVLAALGALGPAIQQMFLDAPAKKGVRGVAAVLDAISGGALVYPSKLTGFLLHLASPVLVCGAILYLVSRPRRVDSVTLAILIVPIAVVLGLVTRHAGLDAIIDLPRTFLTLVVAFAVLAPARLRRWFGIEPLVALGLGGLPLASDWALEMSFPGRGWSDVWALVMGGLLLALASSLTQRVKLAICGGFAVAALVHTVHALGVDHNPFVKRESANGSMSENAARSSHPMLRGMTIPAWRSQIIDWLVAKVPAGSTCFVYANLPMLYDLLACENPTRIDTTIADFPSGRDAREAAAALRAHPPDYLIVYDQGMWMSPPLTQDLEGKLENYNSWNPEASMALHVGLRAILDRYEDVGLVNDALPEAAARAHHHWDVIDGLRIYRRTR